MCNNNNNIYLNGLPNALNVHSISEQIYTRTHIHTHVPIVISFSHYGYFQKFHSRCDILVSVNTLAHSLGCLVGLAQVIAEKKITAAQAAVSLSICVTFI